MTADGDSIPRLVGRSYTRVDERAVERDARRVSSEPTVPIRLLLADRQPVVLAGLESVFGREPACTVLGAATTAEDAVRIAREQVPDVVVLDAHLAGRDNAALAELRAAAPGARIVLFASDLSPAEARRALRSGVSGILMKHVRTGLAVECVRKVASGERWLERRSAGRMIDSTLRREATAARLEATLTNREAEIARYVISGQRNREIAKRLRITPGTVKVHLHNVYRKLGLRGRVELILWAQSNDPA